VLLCGATRAVYNSGELAEPQRVPRRLQRSTDARRRRASVVARAGASVAAPDAVLE
jgi:hypothetical protein